MNETHTLCQCLLSRILPVNLYPSKHKKAAKKPLSYIHVSTKIVDIRNPETGVISTVIVGTTYRKEK